MNTRFKDDVKKLFEYWCEIAPTAIGEKVSGVITRSFPESYNDVEIIKKIPEFAYPCQFVNEWVQTYSFVLTSTDSKWRFGFCRHDAKSDTAMVIITYLPWHDTFLKFLNVLGDLRQNSSHEFQPFLAEAYNKGVPEPGASLKLFYMGKIQENDVQMQNKQNFIFQRPSQFQLPSIPENYNLSLFYNFVIPKNMIALFAAMLAERRIIFTSQRLDSLSCCVQAANALLYPMVWQHIFIPILPLTMKEILCAPMPYLIGVPKAVLETMTHEELGEVVILNCDNKLLETPFDDVKNMPAELVSQLKKQLNNPHEHMGDRVSRIFLRILVQLIGGYRDAIKFTQGQKITWDRETFIESRPSHLRPFLRNMMELQIFQQFIEERLDMLNTGLGFSDEFELETLRYSENVKSGKHYKQFFRNVKDKTNPAVKSAVQSVRQGSRGMKTAYKDLKTKLSDRAPSKGTVSSTSSSSSSSQGNGMATSTATVYQQHHSAPNSPVFTKRPQSELFALHSNSSQHQRKPSSSLQTSNSMTNNSSTATFTNHINNNNNLNNNNNSNHHRKNNNITNTTTATNTTTTTNNNNSLINNCNDSNQTPSPTSSNSSSEMNLLQELQQHALFKSPAVDRSLKPVNSNENGRRTSRSGSIVSTPVNVPIGTLCVLDDVDEQTILTATATDDTYTIRMTASFDTPPDTLPPVPPRSMKHKKHSLLDTSLTTVASPEFNSVTPPQPPLPSSSMAMSFESNFVNSCSDSLKCTTQTIAAMRTSPPLLLPPPLKNASIANGVSVKPKDDNLIELDSANTSFELDDFDPLNRNAKQMPNTAKSAQTPAFAAVPPPLNRVPAFSNPVYPFHVPTAQQTSLATTTNADEDIELLRKYGLDRFHLNESGQKYFSCNSSLGSSSTSSYGTANCVTPVQPINGNAKGHMNGSANSVVSKKETWTTFD